MQFGIVSDSSCDLPEAYLQAEQVQIVSFYISFDGENYYQEGKQISIPDFYQKMADNPDCFPKTSMPSVQDYVDAFVPFVKDGMPVLCICLSKKLSGSMQAAINAKQVVEEQYEGARIEILDSALATALQGMLVKAAVEIRNAGESLDEAVRCLGEIRKSGHIFFTTDDLKYLEHGGRIGKAASVAGSVLKIKPLLQFYDGELGPAELCRGRKKSILKLIEKMETYMEEHDIHPEDYYIVTGVGLWVEEYEQFKKQLAERLEEAGFHVAQWEDIQIGATIGVHTGPYPLGTGLLKRWKKECSFLSFFSSILSISVVFPVIFKESRYDSSGGWKEENMQLIYETLRSLGLTSKYQGYQQLAEATKIVLENDNFMLNVTKNIYPEVAFRLKVTSQSVERNIRTAIEVCWRQSGPEGFSKIAGCKITRIPTHAEFIDMFAFYIKTHS